jgi:hypothetical protein
MASPPWKRYRMQVDLCGSRFAQPSLPDGYRWLPWRSLLLERHAQVKWQSFRHDMDGQLFACLREAPGCLALMRDIASRPDFCPGSTWMVIWQPEPDWPVCDCGTIQGVIRNGGIGSIQNVGVVPEHRRQGLGRALVIQALRGFRQAGLALATLEVTAGNEGAVELYRSMGFEVVQELYRDGSTGEVIPENESRLR